MALEEFYSSVSGNLEEVRGHLLNDERVEKFVRMFFDDPVYTQLTSSMESDDLQTAFRAAHTMKGLAIGMGFTKLYDDSSALTEALRPNDAGEPSDPAQIQSLYDIVKDDYAQLTTAFEQNF